MIKILRKEENYSLCQKDVEGESNNLKYYLDNGEEVSEYFDRLVLREFFNANVEDFISEAKEYF